jgi:hypothetical protein
MLALDHLVSEQVWADPMRWFISMMAMRDIARGKTEIGEGGEESENEEIRGDKTRGWEGRRREEKRKFCGFVEDTGYGGRCELG